MVMFEERVRESNAVGQNAFQRRRHSSRRVTVFMGKRRWTFSRDNRRLLKKNAQRQAVGHGQTSGMIPPMSQVIPCWMLRRLGPSEFQGVDALVVWSARTSGSTHDGNRCLNHMNARVWERAAEVGLMWLLPGRVNDKNGKLCPVFHCQQFQHWASALSVLVEAVSFRWTWTT